MLHFIKDKAKAVASYVADTTSAVAGYAVNKAKDTAEWYTDMRVTPREKVIATLGGIAGVGVAWAAFTLGFGSAPISALTLGVTPLATTALTGVAAGAGLVAKKIVSGALNLAADGIETLAATHPDRRDGNTLRDKAYRGIARNFGQETVFNRMLASEYRPTLGPDNPKDHYSKLKQDEPDIDTNEDRGLRADLKSVSLKSYLTKEKRLTAKAADEFIKDRGLTADEFKKKTVVETSTCPTLFSRGNQPILYLVPSYTPTELKQLPKGTTRSGLKFRNC